MAGQNKKKRRPTRRGVSNLLFGFLAVCLAALYPVRGQVISQLESYGIDTESLLDLFQGTEDENTSVDGSTLEVHYLDIGQGDCTLLVCDGHAMLIDAGDNDRGTQVQSYLESQNISTLDYVIGTHPDSDHIGGLDVIIYKFDCSMVMMPTYTKDTRTYDDVIQAMKSKNYSLTYPEVGKTYTLGAAAFTIVAPNDTYNDANNNSIGILVTHGSNRFLLTGDAEEEAEQDMLNNGMDLKADVFKAAHHGSNTANTEAFLAKVDPTYVVISCGQDNSYGHPHAEVLNTLRAMGIQVFRTDEQGTVVATSDGSSITFNMSPSESWKSGR